MMFDTMRSTGTVYRVHGIVLASPSWEFTATGSTTGTAIPESFALTRITAWFCPTCHVHLI
jgi:hypothetical protein